MPKNQSPHWLLRAILLFAVSCAFGAARASSECPPWLKGVQSPALQATRFADLCALHAEYESARARINALINAQFPDTGLAEPALRLRGVYGPRLVDYSTGFISGPGPRAHSDPWWIYAPRNGQEPTPEVFGKWQDAELWVHSMALDNLARARASGTRQVTPVEAAWLKKVHALAFGKLPIFGQPGGDNDPDVSDDFRQDDDLFGSFYRPHAILAGLYDHLRYPVDADGKPTADSRLMGEWHRVRCVEDLTAREELLLFPKGRVDAQGKAIAPLLYLHLLEAMDHDASVGFDQGGVRRECGYFVFVQAPEIPARTEQALEHINRALSEGTLDPVRLISRLEQWLIGIHPFKDGNGRTIRLMADYVLESLDLPTPIYWTTWNDMDHDEAGWARQIAMGMERTITILSGCADYLEGKPVASTMKWDEYCIPVPLKPTPKPW